MFCLSTEAAAALAETLLGALLKKFLKDFPELSQTVKRFFTVLPDYFLGKLTRMLPQKNTRTWQGAGAWICVLLVVGGWCYSTPPGATNPSSDVGATYAGQYAWNEHKIEAEQEPRLHKMPAKCASPGTPNYLSATTHPSAERGGGPFRATGVKV